MVVPSMEMAGEADNLVLAGEDTGDAERQVGGLSSRSCETHAFCRRNHLMDELGPLDFQLVRCPIMRAFRYLGGHTFDYHRVIVTEDKRTVSAEVIDVLVTI